VDGVRNFVAAEAINTVKAPDELERGQITFPRKFSSTSAFSRERK
jgi:hypothetical protein